jgi:ribosome-associated protein
VESFHKAKKLASLALEKKAQDVIIMDMRQVLDLADYFIICSGDSSRQVKAIADYILEKAKRDSIILWHLEGYEDGRWILLDYGEVVMHVFIQEARDFYQLERLWRDVPIHKLD